LRIGLVLCPSHSRFSMQTKPNIRAVCFDMDGLMFNTEDLYDIVGEELLGRRGKTYTQELKLEMMGLPGPQAFAVMKSRCDLDDPISVLQQETHEIFAGLLEDRIEMMPGLAQLLDFLEEKSIPKGIATSSLWEFANRALGVFDLAPRFQFILTAESVENGKPNPDVYLMAAEEFGVSPEQMLVLEDSVIGTRAAVSAGATTISVPSRPVADSQFAGAFAICQSLADSKIFDLLS